MRLLDPHWDPTPCEDPGQPDILTGTQNIPRFEDPWARSPIASLPQQVLWRSPGHFCV